jgi:hypothetical protein
MKMKLMVAPPIAPRIGIALAANRSEAITPKRDATSVTRLFTTGVDVLTVLRSMR